MGDVHARPRKILLATDLSGRCDRALDRAAMLAQEWKAGLVVVHALESNYLEAIADESDVPSWRRDSVRRMSIAERQIRDDLLEREVPFEAIIEEGNPEDVILKAAKDRDCGLIVTGTARGETFGRFLLGDTVDRLARKVQVPLLVVKKRARYRYRKILVASDFSASSRQAMESAARLFPDAAMSLLHSYAPVAGLDQSKAAQEARREHAAGECARFLDESALSPERRAGLEILLESGNIVSLVRSYAYDKGLDLLVIGSHGRSAILDLVLGSTAATLLSSAPCDVLIVRRTEQATAPGSTGKRGATTH